MTRPAVRHPAVRLIETRRLGDQRGWFSETYSERHFAEQGIATRFVQDNHSLSATAGTLRGLHFQRPPQAQAKLVRCIRGAIWDVAVDLRRGAPSFGCWVAAELTAENGHQLFVPAGFAHGFITLVDATEVIYKVSSFYTPDCDSGLRWDDPDLGLPWPVPPGGPHLSPKDAALPPFAGFDSPFDDDGAPLMPLAR